MLWLTYLGWSSRTQFEETWATLLGVLVTQPITMDQEEETQQEVHTNRTVSYWRPILTKTILIRQNIFYRILDSVNNRLKGAVCKK